VSGILVFVGGASFLGPGGGFSASSPFVTLTSDEVGITVDCQVHLARMVVQHRLGVAPGDPCFICPWEMLGSCDFGPRSVVLRGGGGYPCRFVSWSSLKPLRVAIEERGHIIRQRLTTLDWYLRPRH
jgi:hypothetical protein